MIELIIAFLLLIPFTQASPPSSSSLNFFNSNPLRKLNFLKRQDFQKLTSEIVCIINDDNVKLSKESGDGDNHYLRCNQRKNSATNSFTIKGTGTETSNSIVINMYSDTTVTFDSVNIKSSKPIDVSGGKNLTFIIKGTNTITSNDYYPAVYCTELSGIIFQKYDESEDNKLIATGSSKDDNDNGTPAIGTSSSASQCLNIIIQSGHITAIAGKKNAAGIGTGNHGTLKYIIISGGTVVATGSDNGAAIGSGRNGHVEQIYIQGGDVTATSGQNAAAIGSGMGTETDKGNVGRIVILPGSIVTAKTQEGTTFGAAIGGGKGMAEKSGKIYDGIYISGGSINAYTNGDGAAIGAGAGHQKESGFVEKLRITGGTIIARGGVQSGIGHGQSTYNVNEDNTAGIVYTLEIENKYGLQFCARSQSGDGDGKVAGNNNALGERNNGNNQQVYKETKDFKIKEYVTYLFDNNMGYIAYYPANFDTTQCPGYVAPITPTSVPTSKPTSVPTSKPTSVPTSKPTSVPTSKPTSEPTSKPTSVPTSKPTSEPTSEPITPTQEVVEPEPDNEDPISDDENAQKNNNIDAPSESESSDQKEIPWMIIAIAAGALVLAALLTALILKLRKREKMQPETMSYVSNDSSAIITQDNPLYKDGNDSDDPFKNDFEENDDTFINTTATQI